jgi:hypothetical protein
MVIAVVSSITGFERLSLKPEDIYDGDFRADPDVIPGAHAGPQREIMMAVMEAPPDILEEVKDTIGCPQEDSLRYGIPAALALRYLKGEPLENKDFAAGPITAVLVAMGMPDDKREALVDNLIHVNRVSKAKALYHVLSVLMTAIASSGASVGHWPRPFFLPVEEEGGGQQQQQQPPVVAPIVAPVPPPVVAPIIDLTAAPAPVIMVAPAPVAQPGTNADEPMFFGSYADATVSNNGHVQTMVGRNGLGPFSRYKATNVASHPYMCLVQHLVLALVHMAYDPFNIRLAYRVNTQHTGGQIKPGYMPHFLIDHPVFSDWWGRLITEALDVTQDQSLVAAMVNLGTEVNSWMLASDAKDLEAWPTAAHRLLYR